MANNLARIVAVNIGIASPAADSANFDGLLILGMPPKKKGGKDAKPLPTFAAYSGLDELTAAGYTAIGENADPVGIAARIAFSQNPRPAQVFVATMLDGKTAADTLAIANQYPGWYVICPAGLAESDFEAIAKWSETQTKMFAYTFQTEADPVPNIYFRAQGWYGEDAYTAVAAVAKCLSHPAGSETWAFKQLAAVAPSSLSTSLENRLASTNSNYFVTRAGRNITMNGMTRGGEWIDIIRGRDWLQNDMQLRILNLLLIRPKIPYTNPGIALVENAMIASLKAAQERGIVAQDEFDEQGVRIPGFVVRVPNAATLTAAQRASRVLEGCTFTARIAGAIHAVVVNGTLAYEIFAQA